MEYNPLYRGVSTIMKFRLQKIPRVQMVLCMAIKGRNVVGANMIRKTTLQE
jgi:hypothetical protein